MISFPVKERGSLCGLELVPDWLFPIHDHADLARKQLATRIWQSRLTDDALRALYGAIPPAPLAENAVAPVWRTIYWSVFVPPHGILSLQGSRTFKWRMYGGGSPFYQEGWSDAYGEARLHVGWGLSFVAVDCLLAPGETMRDSLEAQRRLQVVL